MAGKAAIARASATLPQERSHATGVLPAAPQPYASLDLDHVPSGVARPHGHDAIHGHDRRPMNTDEAVRVELVLRLLHRAAPEMRLRPHVQTEVVVGDVQPINVVGSDHVEVVAAFVV